MGPVTLQKLGINSNGNVKHAGYPGYLIKKGSTGNHVKNIQEVISVKVDGIFGPKTEAAVKSYQKQQGFKIDGLVGLKHGIKCFNIVESHSVNRDEWFSFGKGISKPLLD